MFNTIDTLINSTTNKFFETLLKYFIFEIMPYVWMLITAPFTNPSMMWIITPLIISMVLMQLYFGRYRQEELGWNTAFGNSISLIFVSINLLQYIYNQYGISGINIFSPATNKIYLIAIIGVISLIQLIINYFHLIPKKIAFFINSSVLTNMTAYIAIVFTYTDIPLNLGSIIAIFIVMTIFVYVFNYIKEITPMSKEAKEYVERLQRKEERRKRWLAKMELRQERAADAKISEALLAVLFIIISLFLFLGIKSLFTLPSWITQLYEGIAYIASSIIIMKKENLNIYNLNYDGEFREFLLGFVFGAALFVLTLSYTYITWTFVPEKDSLLILLKVLNRPKIIWNLIIFGAVLPVGSELIYRGIILRSLKKYFGHLAIYMQSFIFTLLTFSFAIIDGFSTYFMILTMPIMFINGLILGLIRNRWGLECSIGAHVFANLLGIIL